MDDEALLLVLADAVESVVKTGRRAEYGRHLRMGADGTPTTFVDDLAEAEILRVLARHGDPFNVLSEEAGRIDHGRDLTLVMDPIDGTRNAARGLPAFCVSLALCRESMSDATAGVVRNLCTGDTYVARRHGGAFLNGEPLPLLIPDPEEIVVSVEMGSAATVALRRPVPSGLMRKPFYVRVLGTAALEIALVAQGAMDAYIHQPPKVRIIDIAASALLLREAGGEIFDVSGGGRVPLDMPLDLSRRVGIAAVRDKGALGFLDYWQEATA